MQISSKVGDIDQIGIAVWRPLMLGHIEGKWRRNRVRDRMMLVGGRGREKGEVGGGRGYLGHVQGEQGGRRRRLGQGWRAPSQRVHVSFKIAVHHGISMVNHLTRMVYHFTGVGLSVSLLPVPVALLQDRLERAPFTLWQGFGVYGHGIQLHVTEVLADVRVHHCVPRVSVGKLLKKLVNIAKRI